MYTVVVVEPAVCRECDDIDPDSLHGVAYKLRMAAWCVRIRAFFA